MAGDCYPLFVPDIFLSYFMLGKPSSKKDDSSQHLSNDAGPRILGQGFAIRLYFDSNALGLWKIYYGYIAAWQANVMQTILEERV